MEAAQTKKRIVVVCPGRGSYTKETLGFLQRRGSHISEFLRDIDQRRQAGGDPTVTELDSAEKFKVSVHTKGEHASPLIYACAYADFMAIDRDRYEIVAVCGNSMGWYLTLMFAGALDWAGGFQVIQTMGGMMRTGNVGGQMIYPVIKEDWTPDADALMECERLLATVHSEGIGQAYVSIYLGGYVVLAGDPPGLQYLLKNLPRKGDYPFQLINHAAFHTPLLHDTSVRAFEEIPLDVFSSPQLSMIDGRGHIWQPYSTDAGELRQYTLGHQVYAPYDFTASVSVALKEFAPDHIVLLGPGNSLGGSIGQILIRNNWYGIDDKATFQERQKTNPILLSMGFEEQREGLVQRGL